MKIWVKGAQVDIIAEVDFAKLYSYKDETSSKFHLAPANFSKMPKTVKVLSPNLTKPNRNFGRSTSIQSTKI